TAHFMPHAGVSTPASEQEPRTPLLPLSFTCPLPHLSPPSPVPSLTCPLLHLSLPSPVTSLTCPLPHLPSPSPVPSFTCPLPHLSSPSPVPSLTCPLPHLSSPSPVPSLTCHLPHLSPPSPVLSLTCPLPHLSSPPLVTSLTCHLPHLSSPSPVTSLTCPLPHLSPPSPVTSLTCHLPHLSPPSPVTSFTCPLPHLSHPSPVTSLTCPLPHLSPPSPVLSLTCHLPHLSSASPVTSFTCPLPHLSPPSPVLMVYYSVSGGTARDQRHSSSATATHVQGMMGGYKVGAELLLVSPAGDSSKADSDGTPVYLQLWFMVVMAAVALFLLAIFLGVVLHKALSRHPSTRERPPLVPLPLQRRSPKVTYPPSNSYLEFILQFDTVPDTTSSPSSVTLKGFTMHVEEVTNTKILEGRSLSAGEVGIVTVSTGHMTAHGPSQSHLRRSVSQLIDRKEGEGEDVVWDPYFQAHDSGMFDEEFVDTIKGFSTVRKEHTMFTDTNL
ncbi:hypothetical protein P4O66_019855, partial [Electrophorus voltai]